MEGTAKNIEDFLKDGNIKLPFAKYVGNGLYQIFDGQSSTYMGKELYERFQKLMLQEGLKYTKNDNLM